VKHELRLQVIYILGPAGIKYLEDGAWQIKLF